MTARFHELAAAELAEAVAYYDTKAEGLGDRLLAEVRAAVVYVEEFPESSPVIDRGVRRKVLVKFPYDIFYTLETSEVVALSVAHESRRPGFWRGRTP
jgi:plasmid stabilization system protein ParE